MRKSETVFFFFFFFSNLKSVMNTTVFGKLTHAHFVYSTIHFNMLIKRKTVLNSYKSASRRIDTLSEVVMADGVTEGARATLPKSFLE